MKTLKVKQLRAMLEGVPDNAPVVFQANVRGEEDKRTEATYTIAAGVVYSGFTRLADANPLGKAMEFVIDAQVTDSEGGIIHMDGER